MKRLIRFEDTYGMADIVCLAHNLGLINYEQSGRGLTGIKQIHNTNNQDIFIECGLSFPDVFTPNINLVSSIKTYDIDELVIVYDMDSLDGKGIISSLDLDIYFKKFTAELNRQGLSNLKVKLVPVVWAAETIALYILLNDYENIEKNEKIVEATEIVHKLNTAKLHGKIIDIFLPMIYSKAVMGSRNMKVKKLRTYITYGMIHENLPKFLEYFPKSLNRTVVKWIVNAEYDKLFDMQTAVKHQQKIEAYYLNYLPTANEKFVCNKQSLELNKKCW